MNVKKTFSKLIALVLTIITMLAFAACGDKKNKNIVQDDDGTTGYLFQKYDEDILGTPDKEINVQEIYKKLTYTPEMFYGMYRLLGKDEGVKQYCADMDYIDYGDMSDFKQLTAIPYRLETGKEALHSMISYIKEYNWTRAYFQTKDGDLYTLICSYEIDGATIILRPLKAWEVDKENKKISYTFSEYEFTYEFSFCGRDLTLSKDGKSVTMRTGLNVDDDASFYVSNYLSPGSAMINGADYISMRYLENGDVSDITLCNNATGDNEYHAVAKLSDNGCFTLSVPKDGGAKTYQFVYFYCDRDGIILTDGTTTYYYNDTYSDYYKRDLSNYLSEEESEKFDELNDSQIEGIVEKKENLIEDLAKAFDDAGIKVTVNEATGELAMDASVLFGGDSAVLTDAGKEFLNKFIGAYTNIVFNEKYKGFVSKTKIEGHTAPLSGSTYESGLPLSEERANAVKDYCLSAESGVDPEYISELTSTMEAVGMSNSTPMYDESGNVDLAASRRVSFHFMINVG